MSQRSASKTHASKTGTVYLYHFDKKYRHSAHYLGWTSDLEARDQEHQNGTGARLLAVLREQGIGFRIVRTWIGDRNLERKLKNRKYAPKLCPICNPNTTRGTF